MTQWQTGTTVQVSNYFFLFQYHLDTNTLAGSKWYPVTLRKIPYNFLYLYKTGFFQVVFSPWFLQTRKHFNVFIEFAHWIFFFKKFKLGLGKFKLICVHPFNYNFKKSKGNFRLQQNSNMW